MKFSKGDLVVFNSEKINLGMPLNDFLVFDYSIDESNPEELLYLISDGGNNSLLVKEKDIIFSKSNDNYIEKFFSYLKNITLSFHTMAIYQEMNFELNKMKYKPNFHKLNKTKMH